MASRKKDSSLRDEVEKGFADAGVTVVPRFSFSGKATIKHLNTRKEGPDEEKVLALDVKLNATVSADQWDFFHPGIKHALYTDAGGVQNVMMEAVGFSNLVKGCMVEISHYQFLSVDVKNFKIRPIDGWKADLTFSISVDPDGEQLAVLAEFLQEEVDVTVEPQRELFDEQREAA